MQEPWTRTTRDRKSTRLNSSHTVITFIYTLSLHDALPIFNRYWPCGDQLVEQVGKGAPVRRDVETAVIAKKQRRIAEIACQSGAVAVPLAIPLPIAHAGAMDEDDERSEEHTSELQSHSDHVHLHSFPPRRSSDLQPILAMRRPAGRAGRQRRARSSRCGDRCYSEETKAYSRDRVPERRRGCALGDSIADRSCRSHGRGRREIGRAHV